MPAISKLPEQFHLPGSTSRTAARRSVLPWRKIVAFSLFWALYCAGCVASAEIVAARPGSAQRAMVIKTLIAEAAGEGELGMQAVAEVYRRRRSLRPFSGSRKKNLEVFVRKQGPGIWKAAERAWDRSEKSNITKGATHFENVKAFGRPPWAGRMRIVIVIGKHSFFKEV